MKSRTKGILLFLTGIIVGPVLFIALFAFYAFNSIENGDWIMSLDEADGVTVEVNIPLSEPPSWEEEQDWGPSPAEYIDSLGLPEQQRQALQNLLASKLPVKFTLDWEGGSESWTFTRNSLSITGGETSVYLRNSFDRSSTLTPIRIINEGNED